MALKDVLGQERALEILRGSITKNRIAHAYIFTGEDGIGKKFTAINIAKTLNCEQNTTKGPSNATPRDEFITGSSEIDCCDKCPSCIKIDKAIHPDVFLLTPENGQIKVETIRDIGKSLSYKAFEGKWKIVIIDNADTLNQSAANAFLKTLEEPPDQSLLMLISSVPELILSTIRSRCQRINFSPLPLNKISELLEHVYSVEGPQTQSDSPVLKKIRNKQTALLSMLSGGRPGWALSKNLLERRDIAFNEFKNLLKGIEENLWRDRDAMAEWFYWVQLWLRDIAVLKATSRADLLINQDREKEIKDISKKAELKDILKLSNTLYNIKELLRFNLNKQITLYHTYLLLKKTFTNSS
jgi:DNA polymerase-3 subunit delta'